MSPGFYIVECTQDNVKGCDCGVIEILDIVTNKGNFHSRIKLLCGLGCYLGFRLTHVFSPEKKLTVEIRHINRIKINNCHLSNFEQRQVFDDLASDPTSSDQQNLALENFLD